MYHRRHNVKIIHDAKIVQTIDKQHNSAPVIYNSISLHSFSLLVYI